MATLKVEGYKELVRALAKAEREVSREARTRLRLVGESVRDSGQNAFSSYGSSGGSSGYGGSRASHADSAEGFRVVVRQSGIDVEQSRRKTTGKHPEYGGAQMRHGLLPALRRNEPYMFRQLEAGMRDVADIVNRSSRP